ncbi:hypothetical protein AK88_03435 [Plasmodium fragile]|uniref:Aminomethyltransferase folate-binding domain-containing protein n=1 Tax=Plasmodium fragile TaxID=5857 RepID=A0A0D9QMG4_PLAFR|nr:uncharacterized protein AK88_03435 [Plasmodium fragile]KJP86926.1 hypothetical protein AK88_03435 [Plasmodium fragile]
MEKQQFDEERGKKDEEIIAKLTILKISSVIKNGDVSNCRELILKNRNIEECEELYQMKNLQKIDLSENKIKDMSMLEMNLNLQQIILQHNLIDNINYLSNITNLVYLNLSNNKIKIMDGVCELKNLKTLILAYNEIEKVPNLANLQNLETLILKNNKIETLAKPTKVMTHLKKISLSFNKMREFCFGSHFSSVQELRLNNNKLTHVQRDVVYMTALKQLYIQNNFIMDAAILSHLCELNYLKNIVISENPFFKNMNIELLNKFIQMCKKNLTTINSVTIPPSRKFHSFLFDHANDIAAKQQNHRRNGHESKAGGGPTQMYAKRDDAHMGRNNLHIRKGDWKKKGKKDSFRFLQSLTTNDLNKIITEKDFSLYKNVPKNVLSSLDDTSAYQLCGHNVNHKKWTKGLPSLFLHNNGKILADCFLYNVKYTHEENIFSLFYMDCNIKACRMLLSILEKRKLACDVHFSQMSNIAVYQLLPSACVLQGGISKVDAVGIDGDTATKVKDELSTLSNDPGIFLLSKDARNDHLGYRMYQMKREGQKLIDEKRDKGESIIMTTDFVHSPLSKTPSEGIDQISSENKKEPCEMLLSFVKEEKVNLPATFMYDYMKLNLGVVENLYSNDPLFGDVTEEVASDSHVSTVYGGPSASDTANGAKGNMDRDSFKYKDLSPFDLNYDKLNYLAKDKGCYVGQEAINRTRNEIFINKYQLTMCVNYDYLDMFLENCDSLNKTILADSFFQKYIKRINDRSLLKPTFFLLKNASRNLERAINYEQQFNVIVQKGCAKGGDSANSSDIANGTIVGNVFFYNHVMGLCFLIKKRIALVSGDIYSAASNVYIKNKVGEEHHRVCLFPFNYHSKAF